MKKIILIGLFLILFSINVSSMELFFIKCHDNGMLEFQLEGTTEEYLYLENVNMTTEGKLVTGVWDNDKVKIADSKRQKYANFKSDETFFDKNQFYNVTVNYIEEIRHKNETKQKSFIVNCPGLLFSCTLLSINITKCYNVGNGFRAELTLKGLKPSSMPGAKEIDVYDGFDYYLNTKNKYIDRKGQITKGGELPKGAVIQRISGDNYLLRYSFEEENKVNRLRIRFTTNPGYMYFTELESCRETGAYPNLVLSDEKECEVLEGYEEIINETPKEEVAEEEKVKEKIEPEIKIEEVKEKSSIWLYTIILIVIIALIIIGYLRLSKRGF